MTKRLPCCDRKGFTYVVRCGDFIKIGSAQDVRTRVIELQVGNPYELTLLAFSNGRELERVLHKLCAAHHHRGEWFKMALWEQLQPLFSYERCASCLVMTRNISTEGRDLVLRRAIAETMPSASRLLGEVRPVPRERAAEATAPRPRIPSPRRSRTRVVIDSDGRRVVLHKR